MEDQENNRNKIPLWLDCDPGHDDAFAILFASYHPNLELLGISTVHGNASLAKTTNNALSILTAIGKSDVPVYPGAAKPFCRQAESAPEIHGESGLDGTSLLPTPSNSALNHCNAVHEMRQALLECPENTAWIVATGTLTNVALLFATFPEVVTHVRGLSIMGGAVGNGFTSVSMGPDFVDSGGKSCSRIGNKTPFAEFNIWCDPEAAQSIMQNSTLQTKTFMIPLDVTHQAYAYKHIQDMLLHGPKGITEIRKTFNELLMFFAHTYEKVFGLFEGPPLHDPLAVAVLLSTGNQPGKVDFNNGKGEYWNVNIVLEGEQIGRTVISESDSGVTIPRGLNLYHFWQELERCMNRADEATGFRQI